MDYEKYGGPRRDFVGYGRDTPKLVWPGGHLIAVNLVICYEEGAEYSVLNGDDQCDGWGEYAMAAAPGIRDLGNETHFEYGSRAGIWRIARLLDKHGVAATISGCAEALQLNPQVTSWLRSSPHEVMGHGLRWTEQWTLSRDEERAQIRQAIALFTDLLGTRPVGWNSRYYPSVNTRELLIEDGGFLYDSDSCNDDFPYFVPAPGGRLLIVPYSKTLNDSRYLISPGFATPEHFVQNARDFLDFMIEEAKEYGGGRMVTIAVHARWTGQPNRASALDRILGLVNERPEAVFMRRDEIARHWMSVFPDDAA